MYYVFRNVELGTLFIKYYFMILRVILKNFLSFNDEVQFDMFPNMKRTTLSNHITMLNEKLPVLKMAAIYGANGAGQVTIQREQRIRRISPSV